MEKAINQRVKEVMAYTNLSQKDFAESLGVSQSIVTYIVNERNKVSLDVVQKIALKHPEINLKWLLLGEGEMQKESSSLNPEKIMELIHEVELVNKLNNSNLVGALVRLRKAVKAN